MLAALVGIPPNANQTESLLYVLRKHSRIGRRTNSLCTHVEAQLLNGMIAQVWLHGPLLLEQLLQDELLDLAPVG